MNKGLEKLAARHPDKVASYYRDPDGIWVNLKPGWARWGEVHAVHESTVREIKQAIRHELEPCDCEGCRAEMNDDQPW